MEYFLTKEENIDTLYFSIQIQYFVDTSINCIYVIESIIFY